MPWASLPPTSIHTLHSDANLVKHKVAESGKGKMMKWRSSIETARMEEKICMQHTILNLVEWKCGRRDVFILSPRDMSERWGRARAECQWGCVQYRVVCNAELPTRVHCSMKSLIDQCFSFRYWKLEGPIKNCVCVIKRRSFEIRILDWCGSCA